MNIYDDTFYEADSIVSDWKREGISIQGIMQRRLELLGHYGAAASIANELP